MKNGTVMSDFKDSLNRELEGLRKVRDQLRDQFKDSKTDVGDVWRGLEAQWPAVEATVEALQKETQAAAGQLAEAAKDSIRSLKQAYEDFEKKPKP